MKILHLATCFAASSCALAAIAGANDARPEFPALGVDLVVDQVDAGRVAVMAPSYKAQFGPEGAVYTPFLGAQSSKEASLRMHLAQATIGGRRIAVDVEAEATLDGRKAAFERGLIDEVYELSQASIEQTFVVGAHPGEGDLRLRVAVDTKLVGREEGAGFAWRDADGEGAAFGAAALRNADGSLTNVPTRLVEGGVEIVVPEALLDAASYPLVVDPVIHTLAIENGAAYATESDVAFDLATNTWTVVYQVERSAGDRDAYCRIYDATTMALRGERVIDATLDDVAKPRIANSRGGSRNLVVAQRTLAAGGAPQIVGYFVYPSNLTVGTLGVIASVAMHPGAGCFNPDVGGSNGTATSGAQFCVVYTTVPGEFSQTIHAMRLGLGGAPLSAPHVVDIGADALNDNAAISNVSDGQGWAMAWERAGTTGRDVYGAQLAATGTRTGPTRITPTSTTTSTYTGVSVCVLPRSGATMRWFVAYTSYAGLNPDVRLVSLNNTSIRDHRFLHFFLGTAATTQDEQPTLAFGGGSNIAVAWTTTSSTLVAPQARFCRVPVGSTGLFGAATSATTVSPAGQPCIQPCLGSRLENGASGNADFLEAWTVRGAGDINAVQFRAP